MKPKAEKYYERMIGDTPPFSRWPFRQITAQRRKWRVRASSVYIWISALESKMTNVEVHSGTSLCTRRRGNRRSRTRRLVFYLTLPPYRNYSARAVKQRVDERRTLLDKCEIGARFATERGLTFCIIPELAQQVKERGLTINKRYLLTLRKASSGTES